MKARRRAAKGTVEEHRTRSGELRYRPRLSVAGRRTSFGLCDTEAQARAVLRAAIAELREEERYGLTLRAWGEAWLDRRERDGLHRGVRDSRSIFRTHIATWGCADWRLRKLRRVDVVEWVKGLLRTPGRTRDGKAAVGGRLARQTVMNAFNLLHRMLGDAADEGKAAINAASGVKVPAVPRETEPWTWLRRGEIDALLQLNLSSEQRAVFTVAIYTGLRPGEIFGLRWSDVSETELLVRRSYKGPTKGGRVRRVPLLPVANDALRAWRAERPGVGDALVFPGTPTPRYPEFKGCHAKGFDAGFGAIISELVTDRPVRFYDLRHTCASHLIQGTLVPGLPAMRLEDVQLWLGHRSRSTTERYAHLCPDRLHGLVAMLHAHQKPTRETTEHR